MNHQAIEHESPTDDHIDSENKQTADLQDDTDIDLDNLVLTPSSHLNGRPGRHSPLSSSKRLGKWKNKGKPRLSEPNTGECYLLDLPQDVLKLLLARLPPRSLQTLSVTCGLLRSELEDEGIWRESYVNRFFWDGAGRDDKVKRDVRVLVQACNGEGKGWKREALSREAMLDRWSMSKAASVMHHPPIGLIHSLSLSYPPYVPTQPRSLVVGKTHQTPTKAGSSSPRQLSGSPIPSPGPEESPSPTPVKLTHRQKYEALLAATTRPAPYILSAGLHMGGVVRSDPLSGKVSKGFWGPGRDANFHLRPHLDHRSPPSAIHLPSRSQNYILWGLLTGSVVHTTVQSKHHSTPGSRASSINVESEPSDGHEGEVLDIWAPEGADVTHWVTGGADGRVKLWQLHAAPTASGKRSPAGEAKARIECVFTSALPLEPFSNRSEAIKRQLNGAPHGILLARCDPELGVVCGMTHDGDLRVWYGCGSERSLREVRIDAGGSEEFGPVKRMGLDVRSSGDKICASILVQHHRAPSFVRYDIEWSTESEPIINAISFETPTGGDVTVIETFMKPIAPISRNRSEEYGQFVVAGDAHGIVSIWPWRADTSPVLPIRSWEAHTGKITSIDVARSLVAVGTYDGYIKIYDPYPSPPALMRTFRALHMSAADAAIAQTDEHDAKYYTVNQVILDNDMLVASVGRKVFGWRAGSGKKAGVKGERKGGNVKESKGSGKIDMRSVHREAAETHEEMSGMTEEIQVASSSRTQRHEMRAMEDMGLDGDEALQYALMLSMDDQGGGDETPTANRDEESEYDEAEADAIRQVEAFQRREEEELREAMEVIRRTGG